MWSERLEFHPKTSLVAENSGGRLSSDAGLLLGLSCRAQSIHLFDDLHHRFNILLIPLEDENSKILDNFDRDIARDSFEQHTYPGLFMQCL